MTEAKINLKGKYDDLKYGACRCLIECKELNLNKTMEEVNYGKLFNGTVSEKLKIAKLFGENYGKLEKIKTR